MAYRIDYAPASPRRKTGAGRLLRWQTLTAVFLLVFTLLVSRTWPEGTETLRHYLLPADSTSQAAFQELAADLGEGQSLGDALTAFCRQIIEDGQTPD